MVNEIAKCLYYFTVTEKQAKRANRACGGANRGRGHANKRVMGIEAEDGVVLGDGDIVLDIAAIEKLRILYNNKNHCIIFVLLYTSTTIIIAI